MTEEELEKAVDITDWVQVHLSRARGAVGRQALHISKAEGALQDLAYLMGFDLVKRKEEDK